MRGGLSVNSCQKMLQTQPLQLSDVKKHAIPDQLRAGWSCPGLSRLDRTCADVGRWMISAGLAQGRLVLLRGSPHPLLAPMGSEVKAQKNKPNQTGIL